LRFLNEALNFSLASPLAALNSFSFAANAFLFSSAIPFFALTDFSSSSNFALSFSPPLSFLDSSSLALKSFSATA